MTDPPSKPPNAAPGDEAGGNRVVLEPPAPAAPAAYPSSGGVPGAAPAVRIVHEAPRGRRGPSPGRLLLGFALVLAAVWVASTPADRWREILTNPAVALGWAEPPATEAPPGAAAQNEAPAKQPAWHAALPPVAGGAILLLGGLCLGSGLISYVISATLMGATAVLVDALVKSGFGWPPMLFAGVGLAYLVHIWSPRWRQSPAGIIGWALIGLSCVGCLTGRLDWSTYNWSFLGKAIGEGAGGFFERWGEECMWGTVLLLTAIGVSLSRTKPIHFLNAVLLVALAYYCFEQAKVVEVPFPDLAKAGHIPTLPDVDLKHVAPWQWVLVGDLVLLGAILLHLALGVGGLTVAFAAVWLAGALQVDRVTFRMALTRYASSFAATKIEHAADARSASSRPAAGVLGDGRMGLPIGGPGPRAPSPAGPTAATRRMQQQVAFGAVCALAWVYLTAILAGIIGVSGLRLWVGGPNARLWLMCALWMAFGLGAMWLYTHWPRYPDRSWQEWLVLQATTRYHVQAIWLAALGPMAILGTWALRWNSRYETWLHAAATCILIGTGLSLLAVALLIRFGGFQQLPIWRYAALAAGQSSIMWVLLMHRSLRSRAGAGAARAT